MKTNRASKFLTLSGALSFVVIVSYLQFVQIGYSPVNQLMSELALGEKGQLMLAAFAMFALAAIGAIGVLASFKASKLISLFLLTAAFCLLGAGVFKLGTDTTLHVALVAVAFILLGLVMYLVPRYVENFRNNQGRLVSWGLCAGTALAVALGNTALPIGIGQRVAAGCILLWLCWLAISPQKMGEKSGA